MSVTPLRPRGTTSTALGGRVLVVGGGPSGLAAACELVHRGVDVTVLEPRAEVSRPVPRSRLVTARTMELLRRWGLADPLRRAAPLPSGSTDRVTFRDHLTAPSLVSWTGCYGLSDPHGWASETALVVPQDVLERVLRDHLLAWSPDALLLGARLTALEVRDDGVRAAVLLDTASTHTGVVVEADYVLGCDGPLSTVRRELDVPLVGDPTPRQHRTVVFRTADLTDHGATGPGEPVETWVVGARGPGTIGRLDPDGTWFATTCDAWADVEPRRLVTGLVGRPLALEVVGTETWTTRPLVAEHYGEPLGRAFLVGEAAHLGQPWAGLALDTAVGDAVNIAWKLAAVIQGWGGPTLLASYESERRPLALAVAGMGATPAGSLPADLARAPRWDVADLVVRTKRPELQSLALTLGASYAGSPVVQPGPRRGPVPDDRPPGLEPGRRLPHAWLPDGTALADHLGRGLSLVGPTTRPAGRTVLATRARTLGIPFTLVTAPPDHPASTTFSLVRPDGHVAAVADDPAGLDLRAAVGLEPETAVRGRRRPASRAGDPAAHDPAAHDPAAHDPASSATGSADASRRRVGRVRPTGADGPSPRSSV